MINRLKSKSYGTQFIDVVMDAFDMPTTLTDEYVATLKKEHTSECFDMGGCHEIEEI